MARILIAHLADAIAGTMIVENKHREPAAISGSAPRRTPNRTATRC
jgi:hypothetical protein